MSQEGRTTLKGYFETGDIPTEEQFTNFIDSVLNIIDDGVGSWQKVTINFDDWQPDSGFTAWINAFLVPSGFQLNRAVLIPKTVFSGGTIASAIVKLYDSGNNQIIFNSEVDVFAAITDTSGTISIGIILGEGFLSDIDNDSYIRINLNTTGGTDGINDLTQGSVDIAYRLDKMPA